MRMTALTKKSFLAELDNHYSYLKERKNETTNTVDRSSYHHHFRTLLGVIGEMSSWEAPFDIGLFFFICDLHGLAFRLFL